MHQPDEKIPLLVICGPTASGKTRLSIDMAKQLDGEIVSADSMQIYRDMNVGTAKPTVEEMQGIPHHLIDILPPEENYSLVEYLALARSTIAAIHKKGKLPVLVGGTGLYISSLVDHIQFEEISSDHRLRSELEQQAQEFGAQALWTKLQQVDPELAQTLHPNNMGRVIRALEVYLLTGTTMSELQRRSRQEECPYRLCMIGLAFSDRQALYMRIEQRIDIMLQNGLLDEAQMLRSRQLSKTASQAIGYKELFSYLDGQISYEEAISDLKQATRRYAKRQLTWLRRDQRIAWLEWERFESYNQLLQKALRLTEKLD